MKTKKTRILLLLYVLIVIISAMPNICLADNEKPVKEQVISCSPPTTVQLTVTLGPPDCYAMHNCQIEVVVYDVSACTVDNPPIATSPYVYSLPVTFQNLTINEAYIRVCVRLKPGTSCNETFYPHCRCLTPDSNMNINFNVCEP